MNKKLNGLLVVFGFLGSVFSIMSSESSILPLSNEESSMRLDQLCSMYKFNNFTNAQYVEYGVNRDAIIDRDIAILESDSQKTQATIYSNKNIPNATISPLVYKRIGFICSMLSLGAGFLFCGTVCFINAICNSYSIINFPEWRDRAFAKNIGFVDQTRVLFDFCAYRSEYIKQLKDANGKLTNDAFFLNKFISIGAAALGVAIISGLIALPCLFKYYGRAQRNDFLLKELEEHFDRNQQIIMRLKEIKYQKTR